MQMMLHNYGNKSKTLDQTQFNPVSDDSKTLHDYIVNGELENVKAFLNSNTNSQPYLNENGKSAAFVAIQHRQYQIYSLLLSNDIRFISDDERRILKELSDDERSEFNKTLDKNSNEIKDSAVNFLLSNTKFVNNRNSDKIDIEKYYKELNEIPEIGLMFLVIKCSGFVKIIFDIGQKSTADIEPLANEDTLGICHPTEGKLLIGAKRNDENLIKGTIAHELTHYAMQIVYSNDCKPYHFNDKDENAKFEKIKIDMQNVIYGNQSDIQFDEAITFVFECYSDSERHEELVVRVNQILAFHGKEIGENLLKTQARELLKFYRENVMLHCKNFVEESYLLKPKSEIEIFNLSSGLVTRIKDSAITFVNTFESELEEFIKGENSFLLISTQSSILSAIKLFQSLNQLHLNLNQCIMIDYEKYFKQFDVISTFMQSNSCMLLVLNIAKSCKTENDDTNLLQLLNNMSKISEAKPKFKTTFVFDIDKLANILMQLSLYQNYKYKLLIDTNLGFANLTQQTRLHILMKEIEFQGEPILLKTLTDKNRNSIDENLLTKLISNEKISMGSSFISRNYNPDMYISRELKLINIDSNESKMSEIELTTKFSSDRLIVIADIAGSGKSTLLTHIAILIKQQFNDLWVVRVNLNGFTQTFENKLKTNNQFNSDEAVEFLIKSQQLLNNYTENAYFNQIIFKSNLNKVVVMFDGFDEINPDYATTVQNLVKSTMEANVKQIWLTTRPQCKTTLQSEFQCNSFEIIPLSEQNQLDYLVNFWKNELQTSDKDEELETFSHKMRHSIFYINYCSRRKSFLENPLQLMMFAEALLDQCKEYLESSQYYFGIEERLRKADLYEKFISKKLDVFCDEKLELNLNKVGAKNFFSKEKLVEIHEIAALNLYFNHSKVQTLLLNSHIKQENNFEKIEMLGIIANEQSEFVHLTFAEYFVAKFISHSLSQQQITKEISEIMLNTVFLKDNFEMVRSFLNDILTEITSEMTSKMQEFVFAWEKYFINTDETPFSVALIEENDKIIQLLCTCFNKTTFMRDIKAITSSTRDTSLHLAAKKSNQLLIEMLIEDYKVDINSVNEFDETPLHMACKFSIQDIIQMLIDYGANVNAVNHNDNTPIHLAAESNSKEVVKMLIDNGANVNAVDRYANTPLHSAAEKNSKEFVVKMLIDNGAIVNAVNNDGDTPLHCAVLSNSKDVVKVLIDSGAIVNALDNYGRTPLHCAAGYNGEEVAKVLIDHGSKVDIIDNYGNIPLHCASKYNSKEVVKMMIDRGANVNAAENNGSTPLHMAAGSNGEEVVIMLLDCGANMTAVNGRGMTPLDIATAINNKSIIKILVEEYEAMLTVNLNH